MLISICGSQGAGKSVTIQALSDAGYKVIARKTSRSILSDWGVTLNQVNDDHELTVRFQWEILKRKIVDEAPFYNTPEIVFTERSFSDLFVYSLIALGKNNHYSGFIDEYYLRCAAAQQAYKHVFCLTKAPPIIDNDGVRGINNHYNNMVNLLLQDCLTKFSKASEWPKPVTFIDTLDREERFKIITSSLNV